MYLSRIQLNTHRRWTQWLLASPQRVHAEVLNAFPDAPTGDRQGGPRVLWRLDEEGRKTLLYIVSPDRPDFAKLTEDAGWVTAPGEVKDYSLFLKRLETGSRWAFRLNANPVRYLQGPESTRGKRQAHVTVHHQEQWLADQADRCGFTVTADDGTHRFSLTSRRTLRFTRGHAGRQVTVSTARFDGELMVTDADTFRRTLTAGVGPAKAYGCGLLTIARS